MLSEALILAALSRLSERLESLDVVGELNLLGGTAMVLAFRARQSTKDVDAIFEPAEVIREQARLVAGELDLPEDWLNDAAKGFLAPSGQFRELPGLSLPNLRVQVPVTEYLLAMKVMAARTVFGHQSGDKADIRFLIRQLGLTNAKDVFDIVEKYYAASRIPPRSLYLVEEILAEEGEYEQ